LVTNWHFLLNKKCHQNKYWSDFSNETRLVFSWIYFKSMIPLQQHHEAFKCKPTQRSEHQFKLVLLLNVTTSMLDAWWKNTSWESLTMNSWPQLWVDHATQKVCLCGTSFLSWQEIEICTKEIETSFRHLIINETSYFTDTSFNKKKFLWQNVPFVSTDIVPNQFSKSSWLKSYLPFLPVMDHLHWQTLHNSACDNADDSETYCTCLGHLGRCDTDRIVSIGQGK
jgi:hypothetical protein